MHACRGKIFKLVYILVLLLRPHACTHQCQKLHNTNVLRYHLGGVEGAWEGVGGGAPKCMHYKVHACNSIKGKKLKTNKKNGGGVNPTQAVGQGTAHTLTSLFHPPRWLHRLLLCTLFWSGWSASGTTVEVTPWSPWDQCRGLGTSAGSGDQCRGLGTSVGVTLFFC